MNSIARKNALHRNHVREINSMSLDGFDVTMQPCIPEKFQRHEDRYILVKLFIDV
jgi:hypothetical protein